MNQSHSEGQAIVIGLLLFLLLIVGGVYFGIKRVNQVQDPASLSPTTSPESMGSPTTPPPTTTNTKPTTASTTPMDTATKNLQAGQAFLSENKTKPGVVALPSGLQYKVLREGTGAKPTASQTVEVNYEGRLIDGTIFDSSYKRGQSISFPLSGVIAGWTEGLQHMAVGAKYEFYIPANLAYGASGAGGAIGPNETLIFDVELLSIK